jgi:murein DD-endopeptidase MepM/ murein hydrolase activator NlpD
MATVRAAPPDSHARSARAQALSPARLPVVGPKPTWFERKIRGDKPAHPNLQGLVDLSQWPQEPMSPRDVDTTRFTDALSKLCPQSYSVVGRDIAPIVLKWSDHFGVDPFLLGAVAYWRSNCRAKFSDGLRRGIAALNHPMHSRQIKDGQYRYHLLSGGQWKEHILTISDFGYWAGNLRRSTPALYFAAAFLAIADKQCEFLDLVTGSVAHRHSVSHVVWGDRVKGTDGEDRILTARRRLLFEYGAWTEPTRNWDGLVIQSPLGGTPRKVTSGMGDRRDAGRRRHKGVDFASDRGEPVYAIADGVVAVAGPQMKQGVTPTISAREARAIPREQLARGGLFIMVDHADHKRSAYMHLDTYYVRRGERVKRGQLIGTVGRSGLKGAHAHLHFELREHTSRTVRDRHLDPLNVLGSLVIAPHDTWRGRRLARGRSFVK